jgi:hypothetical protein
MSRNNIYLKSVEGNSTFQKSLISIPDKTISGERLRVTLCDTKDSGSPFANLLSSFNIPITETQRKEFITSFKGTALASLAKVEKFIVVEVSREAYGEMIDGKTIELKLPTKTGSVKLHSSYFGFNEDMNNQLSDNNGFSSMFGVFPTPENEFNTNIAYLFSNEVSAPKDKVIKSTLIKEEFSFSAYQSQSLVIALNPDTLYDINSDMFSEEIQLMAKVSGSDVTIPFQNAVELVTKTSFKPLFPISEIILVNAQVGANTATAEVSKVEIISSKKWDKWRNDYKFPSVKGGYGKSIASFSDEEFGLKIDEPVGIAYLDKGLLIITNSSLVESISFDNVLSYDSEGDEFEMAVFDEAEASLSYKSVVTEFSQTITCVALPEEFYHSSNPTFAEAHPKGLGNNEYVYITEIGLYNMYGDLIAIAKTSEPVKKNKLNVALFSVKLKL